MAKVFFRHPSEHDIYSVEGSWLTNPQTLSKMSGFVVCNYQNELFFLNHAPKKVTDFSHCNLLEGANIAVFNQEEYKNTIKETLQHIKESPLEKVVLSRRKPIEAIDPIQLWDELANKTPNAFACSLQSKTLGHWMGASPEVILKWNNNRFETYSLAGTAKEPNGFSEKEHEEQNLVTQYILNNLSPTTHNLQAGEVQIVKAGPVYHLKTAITFQLKEGNAWHDIVNKINPTPAVVGVPKENAQKWIQQKEKNERKLYTGYWGYVTPEKGALYVNLRVAELFNNQTLVYVGGGITSSSIPSDEWLETERKASTFSQKINV